MPQTLFLSSPTLTKPIVLNLAQTPAELEKLKKDPGEFGLRRVGLMRVTIKEGVDYSVGITFKWVGKVYSGYG